MNEKTPLKFNNGKFKIMAIGDIHAPFDLSDEETRLKAEDTSLLLNTAAERLKPDFAVFMGNMGKDDDEEKTREIIRRITAPLSARNIPYGIVFGNHDPECAIPKERQLELYNEVYDNLYVYDSVPKITGVGNCNVLVKDSDGKEDILNLWFADSNNLYDDRDVSYYDKLHDDQVEWYKSTAAEIIKNHNGRVIPAAWFMHIPVREEYNLTHKAKPYELPWCVKGFGKREGGYYVKNKSVDGYLGEDPACSEFNSGIFDAWKETGDVKLAVFGHDHMNDFAGVTDGIMLAQCKTAGFHVYTDGGNSGVRLITFDENDVENFTTEMHRFKDFGLKIRCLGPVMRNFHDRQVINIHTLSWLGGGLAAAGAAAYGIKKLKDILK